MQENRIRTAGDRSAAPQVQAFVRRASWLHRAHAALQQVLAHGLVLALGLVFVDVALRQWLAVAGAVAAGWLLLVGVATFARAGLDVAEADRRLGLRDSLRTWIDLRRRGRRELPPPDPTMVAWLDGDLAERLAAVPPPRRREVWRRPLGIVRVLAPLLLLVLLLRWLAPWSPLPPAHGSLPGTGGAESAQQGEGSGEAGAERSLEPPPPIVPPSSPPPPAPAPAPEAAVPRAVPDLPAKDEFVVPEFVHDGGERRRAQAPVAVLEQGQARAEPQARRDRPRAGATGGGASDLGAPPADWQRAREEALRARHVPPEERAFVRRYFDELARGAAGTEGGK